MDDHDIVKNEKRTLIVVWLTAVTMVVEVIAGYMTGSMSLLADGWHMASHAVALGIAVIAYKLARSQTLSKLFSFGTGKIIPLGGYSSALLLAMVAVVMCYESTLRFFSPRAIEFDQAIIVASVGLVVNIISVFILGVKHEHSHDHDHDHQHEHGHEHHHDHNMRGAYMHVVADALTSVLAIVSLAVGKHYNNIWLDAAIGILGSLLILKWAYQLARDTGFELLDGQSRGIDTQKIRDSIESPGTAVVDLHVWRIAPKAHACELVVRAQTHKGSAHYKKILSSRFDLKHIIVEEIH